MRKQRRIIIMGLMLVCLLIPSAVSAVDETGRTDYKLTDGVTESTVYVTGSDKTNARVHFVKVGKDANISLKVCTASYYKKGSTKASRKSYAKNWTTDKWGYATVKQMASNYAGAKDAGGTVIAATNGDFYLKGDDNGKTEGKLIMEGNVINASSKEPFFAVLKDGSYVMRDGGADTGDVVEAVAGFQWLLKGGKVIGETDIDWRTVQCIGVTADQEVIIASIDGREPTSNGLSIKDAAKMMKQQGCVDAIQFDCGGSATLLTKRSGNKSLVLRNTPNDGDGFPRPVSSALLVTVNKGVSARASYPVSMVDEGTKLSKTSGGVGSYTIDGKKQTGFQLVNGETYLFSSKGKGLSKTVTIGKTRYTFKNGKLAKCNDSKAGKVNIGFCGASSGGKNLLFAYQNGNRKLNIGLNPLISKNSGKMKSWDDVIKVPWQTKKHYVKTVVVGDGVKNIGGYFLRISLDPFNQNVKKTSPKLTSVTLPSSLTKIDKNAFFNQAKLKKITIPKKVTKIDKYAFAYLNGATLTFKGSKPPTFGSKAMTKKSSAKKYTLKVPKTAKWKKFAGDKKKKKAAGFNGTIKYSK